MTGGLVALVASLSLAAGARALPGDAPIVLLAPTDGQTLPADPAGISVSFQCPDYRAGDTVGLDVKNEEEYDAVFSRSPAVTATGRLALATRIGTNENVVRGPDGLTCTAKLDTDEGPSSPEVVGGRIYWQAERFCQGCEGGFETSPVRSFVVRSSVTGTLTAPRRLYAGYLAVFSVKTSAELGANADVLLQRRAGSRWKTLASEKLGTSLVASLPAGRQTLRGEIVAGGRRFPVGTKTVTVRRVASRATSARDDGSDVARKKVKNRVITFTVTGHGRTLTRFSAYLTTFCRPSNDAADNYTSLSRAVLNGARVAPDGSVTGFLRLKSGSRVLLTGTLRRGHFVGNVTGRFANCTGSRKLDAVRKD